MANATICIDTGPLVSMELNAPEDEVNEAVRAAADEIEAAIENILRTHNLEAANSFSAEVYEQEEED